MFLLKPAVLATLKYHEDGLARGILLDGFINASAKIDRNTTHDQACDYMLSAYQVADAALQQCCSDTFSVLHVRRPFVRASIQGAVKDNFGLCNSLVFQRSHVAQAAYMAVINALEAPMLPAAA